MQILDRAKLAKKILQILFGRLLMDIRDDDNPALDGAHGGCAGLGARVAGFGVGGGLLGLVDVHFGVGHVV